MGLKIILQRSCKPAPGTITLSNVKRLFRSEFSLIVSETMMGHARVTDLLRDPRLGGLCNVEVRAGRHAMVRLRDAEAAPEAVPPRFSQAASTTGPSPGAAQPTSGSWSQGETASEEDSGASSSAPSSGGASDADIDIGARVVAVSTLVPAAAKLSESSSGGSARTCSSHRDRCTLRDAGVVVRNTFLEVEGPPADGATPRSRSTPTPIRQRGAQGDTR